MYCTATENTDLWTQTFSIDNEANFVVNLSTIVQNTWRIDTYIYIDWVQMKQHLTSTDNTSRNPVSMT